MPMFKALKACPHAVVITPDMAKYASVGRDVRELMLALTPAVEPLSIDEAFLDLTGTERLHHAPPAAHARPLPEPGRERDRHHRLDRTEPQQVPRQDRLRSRQAARLCGDRAGGDARVPGFAAGFGHLGRRQGDAGAARPRRPRPHRRSAETRRTRISQSVTAASESGLPAWRAARTTVPSLPSERRRASRPRRRSTGILPRPPSCSRSCAAFRSASPTG